MRFTILLTAMFWLLSLLIMCSPDTGDLLVTDIPLSDEMTNSEEMLASVAWSAEGITLLYMNGDLYRRTESRWVKRALPERSNCRRTLHYQLSRLPNGRLGLIQLCTSISSYRMLQYDWEVDTVSPLIPYDLPKAGGTSFGPDMENPIYFTSNTFGALYWVQDSGLELIPIILEDGPRIWRLSDTPRLEAEWRSNPLRVDKRIYNAGMLQSAHWSPNGDYIALMATLEPMGRPLGPLQTYHWNLYLVNPETYEATLLVRDIPDAVLRGWTPDSMWIAYIAADDGLWILNVASGEQKRIYTGDVDLAAWSPDGESIVFAACLTAGCTKYELFTVDISSLVSG